MAEYAQCAVSPHYFLSRYAKIQNKNTAQTVKWEPWRYLFDLLTLFQKYEEIIILKSRQLGISWLVTAYGCWKTLFRESAKAMYLSQGEKEAWDLLAKSKFVIDNLPGFLRVPIVHDSKSWLSFESLHSEITVLPSTEKAGRGTDATLVVRDELANHPYGKENFSAISPCIDSGGQLIDLSTINKLDTENHFTERVVKAFEGSEKQILASGVELYSKPKSRTILIFLGWKLRPVRQEGISLEDWYELKIKPKYTALELDQEYPESLDQALAVPLTASYFDRKALNDMLLYVTPPLPDITEINTRNGIIKVWKKPMLGRRYVVFSDPSDGSDPFCTVVMDARSYEWVALAHGTLKADEVAKVHDELVRWYNNAYNTGEVNAKAGGKFELTLKELNTPGRAPRRDAQGAIVMAKGGVPIYGWYTTEPIRKLMLPDYEQVIRKNTITVHDKDAINEHKDFIRLDDKPQARKGRHDDYVMAGAGAWQLQKYVPAPVEMESWDYRRA